MGRLLNRLLFTAIALLVAFYGACALGMVYLRYFPPLVTGVQLQRQVEGLLGDGGMQRRYSYLPAEEISVHLRRAVVAAEDTRFYQHRGFDRECLAEQSEVRRRGGTPRGCSTITQQLVKNLFLTTHRSIVRKALEASLTPIAEIVLGKERILELYLNVIEWAPGVYGAEAAARHHYGRSAAELTRQQAAGLAAVIPAPRARTPQRVAWYQRIILRRMGQMGW